MTDSELEVVKKGNWTKTRKYSLVGKASTYVSNESYYPPDGKGPLTYLVPPADVPWDISKPWVYVTFVDGEQDRPQRPPVVLRARSEVPSPAAAIGGGYSDAGTAGANWQQRAEDLRR